ncbi:hypothetical protein [Streptosporangium sp. NPDC002721]|uniref:hypothetical protein n=1 Tax=Streptosporangium sp. NPDC002721 TaxID=3366188 RepID=UPI0036D0E53C
MLEQIDNLGSDPVHQAIVISYLAEERGFVMHRGEEPLPGFDYDAGSFTIGDLGFRREGRRLSSDPDLETILKHVQRMNQRVMARRMTKHGEDAYRHGRQALNEAVQKAYSQFIKNSDVLNFATRSAVTRSELLGDLTYDSACAFVAGLRRADQEIHVNRITEALQLAGFLNSRGHRRWHRDETEGALRS